MPTVGKTKAEPFYHPPFVLRTLFMSIELRHPESDAHKFIDKIAVLTLWHSLSP